MSKRLLWVVGLGLLLIVLIWFSDDRSLRCTPDGTQKYCIGSSASVGPVPFNEPFEYRFRVLTDEGDTLKEFQISHERLMHLIIVRSDLSQFYHLHPEYDPETGIFSQVVPALPLEGSYRVFADFEYADDHPPGSATHPMPDGAMMEGMNHDHSITLFEDIIVGREISYRNKPLAVDQREKVFSGYTVTLNAEPAELKARQGVTLMFHFSQKGQPVREFERYLGAYGHAVVLRQDTLDFIHTHPDEDMAQITDGEVAFQFTPPYPGMYKVFAQFQLDGQVVTADYVLEAKE